MKSDINDLCEAFLAALTNAGYAVKSIENYKQVSNRFKKFCAENGYDTYTVNIGQIFADNVFNEETGAFVGYRNVMYAFATLEMMSDAINKSVPIIGGTEKLWKNKNAKQALYTLD